MAKYNNEKSEGILTTKNIAIGVAGVAIAAGAVAAGVALSDKKTRSKLGKTAKDAFGTAQGIASSLQEQGVAGSQVVGHQLGKKAGELYSRSGKKNSKKK